MSEVRDILEHYGSKVPDGVAQVALGNGQVFDGIGLRSCDGHQMGETDVRFEDVSTGDGMVVAVALNDNCTYYAIRDESVQPCLVQLVKQTDLVVTEGRDEYLPDSWDDEDGEDDDGCLCGVKTTRSVDSFISPSSTLTDTYSVTD